MRVVQELVYLFTTVVVLLHLARSNKFASKLYHQASRKNLHRNIVLSPAATNVALGSVFFGMKHCKELQGVMDQVAHGDIFLDDVTMVNRLFVDRDVPLHSGYQENIADIMKWNADRVHFADPQGASDAINDFIRLTTRHKMDNLFSPTRITKKTKMVVANTAHFHGKWATVFSKEATQKRPFYQRNGLDIPVDTMETFGTFLWGESPKLDAEVVEVPYMNQLSMLILLPRDPEKGLPHLSNLINNTDLMEVSSSLNQRMVHLLLPKFRVHSRIALESILKPLGVRSLFANPNLVDMTGDKDKSYKINTMLHSSCIEVTEFGHQSEKREFKGRGEPLQFWANRPFIFAVKNPSHIYFIGHVAVPKVE
ncbi:serine protease inhibitor 42Dd-like [Drosophila biarmipes]|uniref:serine protease inhibitor 42Dd-like n=1 Tax=Drosophila biarmipes TaxID=125945 RepID=UPI0007E7DD84|nr:serine protease inhibitor 42Dd-like [Drosophila biarmipes]